MDQNPQQTKQAAELRLLVIVATYNELRNLPELVDRIQILLPKADLLVIDDASPDGTGDWCEERQRSDPRFHVIHREGKLGLGSATVTGFRYGLEHENDYQLLATMDADFSHDPDSLVKLVSFLNEDDERHFGVAIGSRYVPGGGVENWPWFRRVSSKAINVFARLVLNLKTRDNSGAFRVYRSGTLRSIDIERIQASSFAYLEEILWRIRKKRISMKELPITFRDREFGDSKASLSMGIGVFWHLLKIRLGIIQ